MKRYLLPLFLVGCASAPPVVPLIPPSQPAAYKLSGYEGPQAMDRDEQARAVKKCKAMNLHAEVQYMSVKTDQGRIKVPVDVYCEDY